jgi:hypothetical protein
MHGAYIYENFHEVKKIYGFLRITQDITDFEAEYSDEGAG